MKNHLVIGVLLSSLSVLSIPVFSQNGRIFEAENAVYNDSIKVKKDHTASEDRYLVFGNNCSIHWKFDNPASGWYKISLRYMSRKGDVAQNIEVNGKSIGVGFSRCNTWRDASFKAYLQKGSNDITLLPGYGKVDIDYLSVPDDSLLLLPAISPVQGVFYKDHPATFTVFADAHGRKIKQIAAGMQPVGFTTEAFNYVDGAFRVTLSKESLAKLPVGDHKLLFEFDDGSTVTCSLSVKQHVEYAGLTLIMFDVDHGNSVLVLLPDGKRLLIDSGKEFYAKSVVMPFLDSNHIDTIDYFILTHYHEDHVGARDEIIKKYNVQHVFDYKSFKSGDTLQWDRVVVTILNAFADGSDENERSLSFLLNWNGFTYSHGADNYAINQSRMLRKFGNKVQADVFYANHHFHGSVNPNFIIRTNPALVVVSAQQAVYARGAFTDFYKEQTEKYLYSAHARLKETLLTLEAGTVVVRVSNSGEWCYETYHNNSEIYLPKKSE